MAAQRLILGHLKGSPRDRIVSFTLEDESNGILPDRMIAEMAEAGLILPAYDFVESQIQPASLDLRLGDVAYRVRASFLPGPDATVAERIDR
jgi:dCTP deaminase